MKKKTKILQEMAKKDSAGRQQSFKILVRVLSFIGRYLI